VGNPALPIDLPFGSSAFRQVDWRQLVPDLVWALPGMTRLATWGFKRQLVEQGHWILRNCGSCV
jgi:hypothetical protein